jgi:hypothetical protein
MTQKFKDYSKGGLIDDQFYVFHHDNPRVYELFKQLALEAIMSGVKHWSADNILHVIRWKTKEDGRRAGEQYKINNNHSSRYARMFAADFPEHENFFRTRRLKG